MSTDKTRLWWIVGTGWALLLLGLGVWSAMRSPATIRDQSPITSGKAKIDTVVAQVGGRLPDRWLAKDSGYLETGCTITPMRDGLAATRTLVLSGPAGTEEAALRKVAGDFKGSRLRPGEGAPESFFADAGDFVAVRARITGEGTMVLELKTGCRPLD